MTNVFILIGLWGLFVATHLGPALLGLRARLISRWGRVSFVIRFTVVAHLVFTLISVHYATHRHEGPRGLALGETGWAVWVLAPALVLGVVLMVAALSPTGYIVGAQQPLLRSVRPPYGLERVTRHPFFAGITLLSLAHMLLVSHLIGVIFFAGFAFVGVFGALHQDKKLTAEKGPDFAAFVSSTSFIPFVAILQGRQHLAPRELPWLFLGLGVGSAALLRLEHEYLMGWSGLGFAGVLVLATGFLIADSIRRAKHTPGAPTS